VDVPVLLLGETGVGKEVFARAIHESGAERRPFVAVNCGVCARLLASELFGYVDGAFTGADAPAWWQDRVGERWNIVSRRDRGVPLELQPYLLRVLEGGRSIPSGARSANVEFRLVAATNKICGRRWPPTGFVGLVLPDLGDLATHPGAARAS